MKTHILIPSIDSYGVMLLIVLSFGSFAIARHLHIRWLKHHFSFVGSNAIVKSMIALLGFFIVNVNDLFVWNGCREIWSTLMGILFGLITIYFETRLIRNVNRKRLITKDYGVNRDENHALRNAIVTSKISLSTTKSITAKGLTHIRQGYSQYAGEPNFLNYSLVSVIIVAIAEEFLFRGYVISIADIMHSKMIMLTAILLSTILFACSHMANAWSEVKCKLPLSILTMAGFLFTGTLLSAIATHITLNTYAYFRLKKISFEKVTHNYQPVGVMR
jgi:hypothetical protein